MFRCIEKLNSSSKVLKPCCNHMIAASHHLKQMGEQTKAMVWCATDYAEDEPKDEKFAARFKTAEIAAEFQHIVNSIAKGDSPPDVSIVDDTEDQVAKPPQGFNRYDI